MAGIQATGNRMLPAASAPLSSFDGACRDYNQAASAHRQASSAQLHVPATPCAIDEMLRDSACAVALASAGMHVLLQKPSVQQPPSHFKQTVCRKALGIKKEAIHKNTVVKDVVKVREEAAKLLGAASPCYLGISQAFEAKKPPAAREPALTHRKVLRILVVTLLRLLT